MTHIMQTATRQDIAAKARALITANGSTTTLDVKNALRADGFWVKQDMVRDSMLDITQKDGDIEYRETGNGYREYFFSGAVVNAAPVTVPASTFQLAGSMRVKINHDNDPATYIVTHADGHSVRQYDNVPRGAAKHLWAKDTGFDFRFARTKKIVA